MPTDTVCRMAQPMQGTPGVSQETPDFHTNTAQAEYWLVPLPTSKQLEFCSAKLAHLAGRLWSVSMFEFPLWLSFHVCVGTDQERNPNSK